MLWTIISAAITWLLIAALAWLVFELVRSSGRLLVRLDALESQVKTLVERPAPAFPAPKPAAPAQPAELPLGSPAPAFELPDLEGKPRTLAEFRGKRLLVIFFSPQCGYCTRMAEAIAKLPVEGEGVHALPLLVSNGSVADNQSMAQEYGLRCQIVLQKQMEVANQYACSGTPMGYLIDAEGKIASPRAAGADWLLKLVEPADSAAPSAAAAPAPAAEPAQSPAPAAVAEQSSDEPCSKDKHGKKPCGRCADKDKANGQSVAAKDDPYDLLDLQAFGTADEMAEALELRSAGCLRMVVQHGGSDADGMSTTAGAALRRFLRQREEWLVAYQPEGAGRFLVLSRDPRDRKELPSLFVKAANFAKALSLHVADGASKLSAEQMERRLEACTLCDRRTGDYCSACGCDLPTKAGWKTTHCPLNKWPAVDQTPAAQSVRG